MNLNPSSTSVLHRVFGENKEFIIPFVLFIALMSLLLGIVGNEGLYLFVNHHYSKTADLLFLNMTNLGDGLIAFVLVLVLLWVSYRESLTFLVITLLLAIVVTVLKDFVFPELDRPVEYFGSTHLLRIINGYNPPRLNTFPSGHSATVFSVCLYLSFLIKNRYMKFTLFLIALFVGFSRVYLSAHFPADVLAGSLIAVFFTILCYTISRRINNSWIDRKIVIRSNILMREPNSDTKYVS